MSRVARTGKQICIGILAAALCMSAEGLSGAEKTNVREVSRNILDAVGLEGGLIVHLGCADGRLTAALRAGESYVVQGLDTDAEQVRQARKYIQKLGIYGPVSAERFDGSRLPYAENLVNLLVAEDLGGVTMEEAIRVLAPGGAVYVKQDGHWTKTVKPHPKNTDEWTHFLHDASGNAVARDRVVGPPRRIQWLEGPRYTRSHEYLPGIVALVSTGGRIFYIVDDGPIASLRQPSQWSLVARDAYNGILLWKRPIATWFPRLSGWTSSPPQLQRKLVAVGNRVYVTLGLHVPLSAVDAATGETLQVYEKTGGAEEVVWHKGVLLLVTREVSEERLAELARWEKLEKQKDAPLSSRDFRAPLRTRFRQVTGKATKAVLALDAHTGRLLWKKDGKNAAGLRKLTLCAVGDRAFYQNGSDVVCLDLKTGRELWSQRAGTLRVACDDSVICADRKTVTALSPDTGERQWTQDLLLLQIRDVFVINGSLWLGGFKPWTGKKLKHRGPAWGPYFVTERDLATGEVLRQIEPENPGHHHRCYANKATDRYILGGRRGTEFIDLATGEVLWNSWARGVCRYGVMPCNGLLYTPPHACGCYIGAKLTGFHALAPEEARDATVVTPDAERLERGPAYSEKIHNPQSTIRNPADWPTYRHDAGRSGCTPTPVPAVLRRRWQTNVEGKLTALTVAEGKVFVASMDDHRIAALDAESGRPAWSFTAGARVDSPPTVYQGRAFFGCRDGYVYSLRVSDGALAWRLQAARLQRRITARGQLEAASPVMGSVLVQDGVVHATAGRSSYMDGGLDLYRLKPGTGTILSKTSIYSPDPKTGRQPPHTAPATMPGAREDILSADGGHVYLRDMVFDKRGNRQPGGDPHLFTLTGFLDASRTHRSYWIFGTECSISTGCSGRDRKLTYGRLLVFDEAAIFGYGRSVVDWSNELLDGPYRLFAQKLNDRDKRGKRVSRWERPLPIQVRAMVLADKVLFVAGPPADISDSWAARDRSQTAVLMAVSAADGSELARYPLDCPPVFDGMAAANGRLYISLENGQVACMDKEGAGEE